MWKQLDIKGRRHGFYIYTHTRPRHSAQSGRGATTAYITTTYRSPCLANCSEASAAAVSKKNERKTAKKTKEISASATAHACRASHAAGRSHAPPTAGGQLAVQTAVGNALPEQTDWREESTVAWRLIFSTRKKKVVHEYRRRRPFRWAERAVCVCVCALHLILFRAVHRNGDGDGDGDGVFGVAEERRHHAVWRDGWLFGATFVTAA